MTVGQPSRSPASQQVWELYGDALDRPPLLAPAPEKRRGLTSLWRFRPYLRPYLGRFVLMFAVTVGATLVAIVTPLVTVS